MHCRHTCIAAHTGQMHVLLWTCTHTCKSGDGMGTATTLKWMLARARDQGEYVPLSPVFLLSYRVFSKVLNSLAIHQYFPTASPYGAQSGGWIGTTD